MRLGADGASRVFNCLGRRNRCSNWAFSGAGFFSILALTTFELAEEVRSALIVGSNIGQPFWEEHQPTEILHNEAGVENY